MATVLILGSPSVRASYIEKLLKGSHTLLFAGGTTETAENLWNNESRKPDLVIAAVQHPDDESYQDAGAAFALWVRKHSPHTPIILVPEYPELAHALHPDLGEMPIVHNASTPTALLPLVNQLVPQPNAATSGPGAPARPRRLDALLERFAAAGYTM